MPYVQFTDDSETAICAAFPCPQNEEEYPGQMELPDDDERYFAFMAPKETAAPENPIDKLKAFLAANPDVAEILK